ncbi:MAG: glycosyltransferase [Erysipelotrichaceae bacterium]
MSKISMIVPVYNTSKYLKKCLDSIVRQTFQDFEAIIINDGSTDDSEAIILPYTKEYPSLIKYYYKTNGGIGSVRNFGLEKATSEYLCFVDSDDCIDKDYLKNMIESMERNKSDLCICGVNYVNEKTGMISSERNHYTKNPTDPKKDKQVILNRAALWDKLYRRSLFEGVKFVEGKWYEDLRVVPILIAKANSVTFVDEPLYFYLVRNGSIMNNEQVEKNIENLEAFNELIDSFKKANLYEAFKDEIGFLVLDHVLISTVTRIVVNSKNSKQLISKVYDFINSTPNLYGNKYMHLLSKNRRIIYFLNKHRLFFITKFIFKLKNI